MELSSDKLLISLHFPFVKTKQNKTTVENSIFGAANIEFPNMRKRGILLVKIDWDSENL